jgi:hypothetical protein
MVKAFILDTFQNDYQVEWLFVLEQNKPQGSATIKLT